jgi:hypothetical protein
LIRVTPLGGDDSGGGDIGGSGAGCAAATGGGAPRIAAFCRGPIV